MLVRKRRKARLSLKMDEYVSLEMLSFITVFKMVKNLVPNRQNVVCGHM